MRRELIFNWAEAHRALAEEMARPKPEAFNVGETGKGWTYVTFFGPGTQPDKVLYDVSQLEETAHENGYFLPREVLCQHNKIVLSAYTQVGSDPSIALFGLVELLEAYARKYNNPRKYPNHGFYGKLGGFYDRPEKGRVLALYSTSDEALLAIEESLDELMRTVKVKYASFDRHFSNGLSAIPRMLDGFDDPEYRGTGATHFRITDPSRFESLLEQARLDYGNYIFE